MQRFDTEDKNTTSNLVRCPPWTISCIAILDTAGNRILSKYYDENIFSTSEEQKIFELKLFEKTRIDRDIFMLDGQTCVHRSNVDWHFYVTGSSKDHELMLKHLLQRLCEHVNWMLRRNIAMFRKVTNLELIAQLLDRLYNEGMIWTSNALLDSEP